MWPTAAAWVTAPWPFRSGKLFQQALVAIDTTTFATDSTAAVAFLALPASAAAAATSALHVTRSSCSTNNEDTNKQENTT